jgi:hypothetical protein
MRTTVNSSINLLVSPDNIYINSKLSLQIMVVAPHPVYRNKNSTKETYPDKLFSQNSCLIIR